MVFNNDDVRLAVIGLGYVGLPLAVSFARHYDVVGFDINDDRVRELQRGIDRTREVSTDELAKSPGLRFTTEPNDMKDSNVFIVTTPTPIDEHKNPDMSAVLSATRTVGSVLKTGDTVIYESTVYPGATEDECAPLLEEISGLRLNEDFFIGYSPERINPGDKEHRFETICKVTSGSTPDAAQAIDALYGSVVTAGTHLAPSIKIAEAAKVIENTQRDVNIALINELALLFNRLGIDTQEVLEAAGTKWNFLRFQPGLVGGHCIGVDPYYLTHKAHSVGYHPEIILAGRRLNDSMGSHVASRLVMEMLGKGIDVRGARVLLLGFTFKENTPDIRNTRVIDIYRELQRAGIQAEIWDPWADAAEARAEYGVDLLDSPDEGAYAGIVLAVPHEQFRGLGADKLHAYGIQAGHVLFDLKAALPREVSDLRL